VTIDAVIIIDSSHAEILGTWKVNGGAPQPFRGRVDITHPAAGEMFSDQLGGLRRRRPGRQGRDRDPCSAL